MLLRRFKYGNTPFSQTAEFLPQDLKQVGGIVVLIDSILYLEATLLK